MNVALLFIFWLFTSPEFVSLFRQLFCSEVQMSGHCHRFEWIWLWQFSFWVKPSFIVVWQGFWKHSPNNVKKMTVHFWLQSSLWGPCPSKSWIVMSSLISPTLVWTSISCSCMRALQNTITTQTGLHCYPITWPTSTQPSLNCWVRAGCHTFLFDKKITPCHLFRLAL